MASVLANGRILGGVSGCTARIAAASLIPRGSAPVNLWYPDASGLSRAIPKGRMIIPIRTLYEDFLQQDFSEWYSPSDFLDELRWEWSVKADPLPWPDTYPALSENGDFTLKILARDAMTLHLLASKLLSAYYRIERA